MRSFKKVQEHTDTVDLVSALGCVSLLRRHSKGIFSPLHVTLSKLLTILALTHW